ncbi:MAG: hypothetical protein ACRDLB_05685 [Actinomycetota bacterium]
MAQTMEGARAALSSPKEGTKGARISRKMVDLFVSWTGAVMAVALLALGGAAIFGGSFALENVRDRLEPQNIAFPPAAAMTPAEKAEVGDFAGRAVDTGTEAEAFSRYIGLHLDEVNEGKTYSETSAAARAEGLSEDEAAELQGKADTLFRGETLRAILLNAYGWWIVGQIAFWAGIGAAVAGAVLALFVALGFRHARTAT